MKDNGMCRLALFLGGWTLLNLLQAALTGLDPDEAYYRMYARSLDWGYFDHPPAVAVMIRLGAALLPGTLGVRLLTTLLSTAALFLTWDLAGRPRDTARVTLLMVLLAAMPLLEVYGFIATPDGPLLFFTVVFFWLYRRFVTRGDWGDALTLGAGMALLLYSKYHGILVIGFTVLSNLALLRRPLFYLAAIFGALLFMPHLYWQYAHDFPSVRYHLSGRDDPYELKHTVTYVLNQLVIFNPLVFPLMLAAFWRGEGSGAGDPARLGRAFRFVITGFWIFFFWTTFKGHVEPQWTAALSVPLVLLTFHYAAGRERYTRRLRGLAVAGVVILLLLRLAIMADWLPPRAFNFTRPASVEPLADLAGEAPVVFVDSYRDPSLYTFYTGRPAYTYRTTVYRANQYDIWAREPEVANRRVLLVNVKEWGCDACTLLPFGKTQKKVMWVDSLPVVQQVTMDVDSLPMPWRPGQEIALDVVIHNPYSHDIYLDAGPLPVRPVALFEPALEEWIFADAAFAPAPTVLPAGKNLRTKVTFTVPPGLDGGCAFGLGLRLGDLAPSPHTSLQLVQLTDK